MKTSEDTGCVTTKYILEKHSENMDANRDCIDYI